MDGWNRLWKTLTKKDPQPKILTPTDAYALSSVGKVKTLDEILESYKKHILRDIKEIARYGRTHVLIEFPQYLCEEHKLAITSWLNELQYTILFTNDELVLVSWKKK